MIQKKAGLTVFAVIILSTAFQAANAAITVKSFDRVCYDPGSPGRFMAEVTNPGEFTMYVVGASLTINGVGIFQWSTTELPSFKEIRGQRAEALEGKQSFVISIAFQMPKYAELREYETTFAVFYRSQSTSLDVLQYEQGFPTLMMCGSGPLHPAVVYTLYVHLLAAAITLFFFPTVKRVSRKTALLVKIVAEAFLVAAVVWSVVRVFLVGSLDYFVVLLVTVILFEMGYWREELGVNVKKMLGIMAATLSVMIFASLVFRPQFSYFFIFLISLIEIPAILTCAVEAIDHHNQKGASWPTMILTASAVPFVILALTAIGMVIGNYWVLSIQVAALVVAAIAVLVAVAVKWRETWYAQGSGKDNLETF